MCYKGIRRKRKAVEIICNWINGKLENRNNREKTGPFVKFYALAMGKKNDDEPILIQNYFYQGVKTIQNSQWDS